MSKSNSISRSDYRQVQIIKDELHGLLKELLPETEKEMKISVALNLSQLSQKINTMNEMPENSPDKVRLRHENRQELDTIQKQLSKLVKNLALEDPKNVDSDKHQQYTLLQTELKQLYVKNLHESVRQVHETKRLDRKERKNRGDRKYQGDGKDMSREEAQFMREYQNAYQEQDELLDEISKGMDELKEIANGMNSTLKLQNNLLDNVEVKVVDIDTKIVRANKNLKQILTSDNACCVWSVRLIICIILLTVIVSIVRVSL
jgi:methyl-accepting chemotaxis protein